MYSPREAAALAMEAIARGKGVGLLFGSEIDGLRDEELASAHGIVTIPTFPGNSPLAPSQSALLMCYEWSTAAGGVEIAGGVSQAPAPRSSSTVPDIPESTTPIVAAESVDSRSPSTVPEDPDATTPIVAAESVDSRSPMSVVDATRGSLPEQLPISIAMSTSAPANAVPATTTSVPGSSTCTVLSTTGGVVTAPRVAQLTHDLCVSIDLGSQSPDALGRMRRNLAAGADPSRPDPAMRPTGASPVYLAAAGKKADVLALLLEFWPTGRPMPRIGKGVGVTPLLKMCKEAEAHMQSSEVEAEGGLGEADDANLCRCAALLLDADPEAVDAADQKGWTPLQTAAEWVRCGTAESDLPWPTCPAFPSLAHPAYCLWLSLHANCTPSPHTPAALLPSPQSARAAQGHLALIDLLLSRGADVHLCDKEGLTALHWAAESDSRHAAEAIRKLLACGADVEAETQMGQTPMAIAVQSDAPPATVAALKGEVYEGLTRTRGEVQRAANEAKARAKAQAKAEAEAEKAAAAAAAAEIVEKAADKATARAHASKESAKAKSLQAKAREKLALVEAAAKERARLWEAKELEVAAKAAAQAAAQAAAERAAREAEAAAKEEAKDTAVCGVCGDGVWTDENKIIFCDGPGCGVAVHQGCYFFDRCPPP